MKTVSLFTPFPDIPENIRMKYSINGLSIRGFGQFLQDININFESFSPYVITKVLQCCTMSNNGDTLDESFFWDLTIGKRIECLLTIVSLSDISELFFEITCLNPICHKQIQVELSIDDLKNSQHMADEFEHIIIQLNEKNVLLRKPNGFDQLKIAEMEYEDENTIARKTIQLLVLDNIKDIQNQIAMLSSDVLNTIDNALSEVDPLINFSISIRCPYCDNEGIYAVELDAFTRQKLYQVQSELLNSIHKIARNYHWSEEQIISLPPWRRSRYLSLIEKEAEKRYD